MGLMFCNISPICIKNRYFCEWYIPATKSNI